MNHPELDELLGLVRDDDVEEQVRHHLDECTECAADLRSVTRLDVAADLIGPERAPGGLVAPPSSVWDRVQADLAAESVAVAEPAASRRPRRPVLVAAAAAVAGVVIGGLGGYLLADDGTSSPDRAPIAAGTLEPVGQDAVSGDVAMSQGDSTRLLTITFAESVPGPGYLEAWLFDPLTDEMLGLGVLGAGGGTVSVPPDVDLSRFTAVDISREPFDGDPAHSAESIARGVLRQL